MVSIGDKVICKHYEMENLYANRIYTISEIIEDKYIILKGDKYKIIHRMDSFVIDLKETRKSKIDKLNKYIWN